jgi:hypothetical protein
MMHPALAPLADLIGTFEGDGRGDYPTIDPFRYRERVVFSEHGKPFLTYQQHTWHPDTAAPMHTEVGYLRVPGAAADDPTGTTRVELVVAQPTGIVEVDEGTLDDGVLTLATTTLGRTATAKDVRSVRRTLALHGDLLVYDLWMAYAHVPDTHHLHAELRRTG